MKKIILFFLLLSVQATGQQRIGLDISTRMSNLNLTVHYQRVLKGNLLFSGGLFYGSMGQGHHSGDTQQILAGFPTLSPHENVNQSIQDSVGTASLLEYIQKGRTGGIQFGLGYFHAFGVQHGLRMNTNLRFGYATQLTTGYYWSEESGKVRAKQHYNGHLVSGVTMEAYHTIRTTGRLTFYYGVKVPYYFSLDKSKFNPRHTTDVLYGFEPELSIGMTRVIGKCE